MQTNNSFDPNVVQNHYGRAGVETAGTMVQLAQKENYQLSFDSNTGIFTVIDSKNIPVEFIHHIFFNNVFIPETYDDLFDSAFHVGPKYEWWKPEIIDPDQEGNHRLKLVNSIKQDI